MKNYILQDGKWTEDNAIILSPEERTITESSPTPETQHLHDAVREKIATEKFVSVVDEGIIAELDAIYTKYKPEEDFSLMGVYITLEEGQEPRGIFNAKVGPDFQKVKQIRFFDGHTLVQNH